MDNIKISVIVPVYNVEKYICKCLDSIINQTYTNLEIILVDDGSKDSSGKICDVYAKKDNRISVIHKPNGGHISARKAGVAIATGDYINFVDSDDWIDINAYYNAIKKVIENKVDIVIYGHNRVNDAHMFKCYENLPEGLYDHNSLKEHILVINDVFYHRIISTVCWNKLIKTSIIRKNIDKVDNKIKIGEDAALVLPCVMASDNIYIIHDTLYNYRLRETSMMHEKDINRYKNVELVTKRLSAALKENNLDKSDIMQKQFFLYFVCLMLITDASYFFDDLSDLYTELKENDRIAIYGKGVFAQSITFLAKKNKKYSISGYFDSSSVNELYSMDYDYIIIAVTVSSFVEEMLETLKKNNIPSQKILYLRNEDMENLGREKMKMING